MKTAIIEKLEARIVEECTKVDREERFNSMLDECYSFESVGGIFANMCPSSVLKEVDPTAYRCGVNDFSDSEGWIEVGSDEYEQSDVEAIKEALIEELEAEISELEAEIEELEADEDDVTEEKAKLAALKTDLATLNKHSF